MAADALGTVQEPFFIPDLRDSKAVFWLVLLAELFVLILVLALPSSQGFDWSYLALVSFLVQWVVLISAALIGRLRVWLQRWSLPAAVAWVQLVVLSVTLLCSLAGQWLVTAWRMPLDWEPALWHLLRNLLIAALVSGMLLRYFYLRQALQFRQQAELEARLQALQARMRPHFLFNTLNSIIGLVHQCPDRAEEALLDLSDLLRASLEDAPRLVALKDELALCRGYLRIEALRLGERLQLKWALDLDETVQVPPFCLQPLLENAIVHGIARLPEGGVLEISGGRAGQECWLQVRNRRPEVGASEPVGHRMAQSNIQARLKALFGDRARLDLRADDGCYSARLCWPVND